MPVGQSLSSARQLQRHTESSHTLASAARHRARPASSRHSHLHGARVTNVTCCHAAPALVPPVEVAGAAVVLLDAAPALALQVLGQVHRHQPAVEHRRYRYHHNVTRGIGSSPMPYWSWKVTVLMTRTSLSTVSDLAAWQERRWCEQQPPQRSSRVQPGHTSV